MPVTTRSQAKANATLLKMPVTTRSQVKTISNTKHITSITITKKQKKQEIKETQEIKENEVIKIYKQLTPINIVLKLSNNYELFLKKIWEPKEKQNRPYYRPTPSDICECLRMLTEIYYYFNEYKEYFINNDKEFYKKFIKQIRNYKDELITNPVLKANHFNEESEIYGNLRLSMEAFDDEFKRATNLHIGMSTLTDICSLYDPELIKIAKNEFHCSIKKYTPTNINSICDNIHTELELNFNEINILIIIANYLFSDPDLTSQYTHFIYKCPDKFLMTYMNNSEKTPQLIRSLKKRTMSAVYDFLVGYIHNTKIKTWIEREHFNSTF